jgi:hypothetical protein
MGFLLSQPLPLRRVPVVVAVKADPPDISVSLRWEPAWLTYGFLLSVQVSLMHLDKAGEPFTYQLCHCVV